MKMMLTKFSPSLTTREYFEIGKNHLSQGCQQEEKNPSVSQYFYTQAAKAFKKIDAPELGEVYLKRGDIYCRQGLFKVARAEYEKAQRFDRYKNEASRRLANLALPSSQPVFKQLCLSSLSVLNPTLLSPTRTLLTTQMPVFFQYNPPLMPAIHYLTTVTIDEIRSTHHLAACLQDANLSNEQREALRTLAFDVIEAFAKRSVKTPEFVYGVTALATIPEAEIYHQLISQTINVLAPNENVLLQTAVLQGLAVMLRNLPETLLNSGGIPHGALADLLKVLQMRLVAAHSEENTAQLQALLQAVSQLLDAMVRVGFRGINREQLQEPLDNALKRFSQNKNPTLAYQACYARQALAHIPNNESDWQAILRRTFNLAQGTLTLASTIQTLDPDKLLRTFANFSDAFAGVGDAVKRLVDMVHEAKFVVHETHQLMELGQKLMEAWQHQWYKALRFIDLLIEENQLIQLRQFVSHPENPYRQHEAFLQGLCQRLEQIACTQTDAGTQQDAVLFLANLVQNKQQWGNHASVNQLVLTILARLVASPVMPLSTFAQDALNQVAPEQAPEPGQVQECMQEYVPPVWHPNWQRPSGERLLISARQMQANAVQARGQYNAADNNNLAIFNRLSEGLSSGFQAVKNTLLTQVKSNTWLQITSIV